MTPVAASAQKIDCQDQCSSSSPEPSMLATAAQPDTPAQMPTALVRSAFGYADVSSDSVAGITKAAPAPAAARATISCIGRTDAMGRWTRP